MTKLPLSAHAGYLKYVLRHKWFVYQGCRILEVPLRQALVHDWTKFTPIEWFAYVDRFHKGRGSTWQSVEDTSEYNRAWKHHWSHNPHHWEYWLEDVNLNDPNEELLIGDYVVGTADNGPLAGYVVERRAPRGSPRSEYRIQSETHDFWAYNFEIQRRVYEMPEKYTREMVADWFGAGMAQGKPDIVGWRATNGWRQTLHPRTADLVDQLLLNF